MRVLVVDYITYLGHRNFNKIHVEALSDIGCTIRLVGRKSAIESVDNRYNIFKLYFPEWITRKYHFYSISERIKNIVSLCWVKHQVDLSDYDVIIFLAYDILSVSFFRVKKNVILVNHNNISQLNSTFKRWLTRLLPSHYCNVALTRDSELFLNSLSLKNVCYVPHGYVKDTQNTKHPECLKEDDEFLLCPINGNYNATLVQSYFNSQEFNELLTKYNIKLVIKNCLLPNDEHENIIKLKTRISDEEYHYMMKNALAVILPYDINFKYRCSGMLYECIAANTPVIASKIDAMELYRGLIDIKLFDDVQSLIDCIKKTIGHPRKDIDKSIFEPNKYWQSLLSKMSNSNE